jgi:nitric oxide reductase activation protein
MTLRQRGPLLAARPERLRLLVVVHDGAPVYRGYPDGTDWDLSLAWLRDAPRRGVVPIGIFLAGDERRDSGRVVKMQQMFERLIVCRPADLAAKLGNLLRSFAG